MQTIRDCIKDSIKHTLKSLNKTALLEEKLYNDFVKEHELGQKQLNRLIDPGVYKKVKEPKMFDDVPQPDKEELLVLLAISSECNVEIQDILGRNRKTEIVDARKIYMIILYVYFNYKLVQISLRTNRDHSTIIHAINVHDDLIKTNASYREKFKKVLKNLHDSRSDIFTDNFDRSMVKMSKKIRKEKWTKFIENEETN